MKSLTAIRASARFRMAEMRTRKKKTGECRRCQNPVAVRNGVPMSACRKHLDDDAKRKREKRKP